MDELWIDVLGPPVVRRGGRPLTLRGRSLALVLRLVVAGDTPVAIDRLHDDIWGDRHDGDGAVRVALTRVRKSLGSEHVVRVAGGYSLAGHVLDADRFERSLQRGCDRSLPLEQRVALLGDAIDTWRGDAYAGVEHGGWLDPEISRLHELREQAVDERLELRALLHEPAALVPELTAEVEREPLRERRVELLATALYRAHRHTDALTVLRRHGVALRDQLGLDPGPALRDLEHRILVHDPSLAVTPLEHRRTVVDAVQARLRAARTLTRVGAYAEADAMLRSAETEARAVGDRGATADCLLARAVHATMSGRDSPTPLIDEARELARALHDGRLLARVAVTRFGSGASTDLAAGLVEILEPLELLPEHAPERVDLLCAAAVMVVFVSGSDAAQQLLDAATELDGVHGTHRSGGVLAAARCLAAATRGAPPEELLANARASMQHATEDDDPELTVVAGHAAIRARYAVGDLDGVDEVLGPLLRAGRAAMLPFAIARVSVCRTTNALARGELDHVERLLAETSTLGERLHTVNTKAMLLGQRSLLEWERGRLGELVAELGDASRPEHDHRRLFAVVRALATRSVGEVAELLDDPPEVGADGFAALVAFLADELEDTRLAGWVTARLEPLRESVIGVGLGTLLFGFAPQALGTALLVVGDHDRSIEELGRAAELSEKAGAWLWRDHTCVTLARALARRGGSGDAEAAREILAEVRGGSIIDRSERLARAWRRAADELASGTPDDGSIAPAPV